jgi:hypothetical protein
MTPEKFQEIITDKEPGAALEALKGELARGQAEIMEEVMLYKSEGAKDDDDDEEE